MTPGPRRSPSGLTRVAAVVVSAALAHAAAAQTFIHLRHYDISNLFNGSAVAVGQAVIDVAYDGRNVYLVGVSVPPSGPEGVVRIDDILTFPSGSVLVPNPIYTRIFRHDAIPTDCRISHWPGNGFYYVGTGLTTTAGGPDVSGVRRFDALGGFVGLTTPGGVGYNQIDSMDLDPRFGGGGPTTFDVVSRFDNNVRQLDPTTGAIVGTLTPVVGSIVGMRDISFAPNGDLWYHQTSGVAGIYQSKRICAGFAGCLGAPTLIAPLPGEPDGPQATVHYLQSAPVALPDLILHNMRGGMNLVFVRDTLGALKTFILGNEPTTDGYFPALFNYWWLNYKHYRTTTGRVLVFVVQGTTGGAATDIDRLDIYELRDAPTCPEGDVNGDGCVDQDDMDILLFNFSTCP